MLIGLFRSIAERSYPEFVTHGAGEGLGSDVGQGSNVSLQEC